MFSSKLTALFLAAVVGTGAVAAPAAVHSNFGPGKWKDTPLGRLISGNIGRLLVLRSEMNISDEQRRSARAIVKGHKDEIAAAAANVHEKRKSLRGVAMSDSASEQDIREAADHLGDAISDAVVLGTRIRRELKPIFTEEQRELVQAFMSQRDGSIEKFLDGVVAD